MIEVAFISGRHERIFCYEGKQWHEFSHQKKTPTLSSTVRATVLEPNGEYQLLEQIDSEQLAAAFDGEVVFSNALFVTLTTLDTATSISTRVGAAQVAEELLQDSRLRTQITARISSWPLPQEVLDDRHRLMQVGANFGVLLETLREILDLQPYLRVVIEAWTSTCKACNVYGERQLRLRSVLIDDGFFAAAAKGVAHNDTSLSGTAIVSQLLKPGVDSQLKDFFQFFRTALRSASEQVFHRKDHSRFLFKNVDQRGPSRQQSGSTLEDSLRSASGNVSNSFKQLGPYQAKQRVDKQISAVRTTLFQGKLSLAERYVKELMQFQLGQDDRIYAVKSLCNLSSLALEANQFDFAHALIDFAAELDPQDKVTFTARAEMFKQAGDFTGSLYEYDEVLRRFSAGTYPLNGKAEVLHQMGDYAASLRLFDAVQRDFPDDPVAFNGQVGVLRTQGKLREALQLAVENAKRFPSDPVIRIVLGGTLAANGKYLDAVRQFKQAFALDSSSSGAISSAAYAMRAAGQPDEALVYLRAFEGKRNNDITLGQAIAQILQGSGQYTEAKAAYEKVLAVFPAYTPALLGLKAVSVLQDSNVSLEDPLNLPMRSERDWQAFRIYAVSLVTSGRAAEAASLIEKQMPSCPWARERARLQTTLGIAQMRASDASCIQTLQTKLESLDDSEKQGRLLLLSHAQIEYGSKQTAGTLLRGLVKTHDKALIKLRVLLLQLHGGGLVQKNASKINHAEISFALAA